MKLLLVSDLHYALKQFDWTLAAASKFDVVVLCGDHLDISGHVDGRVQIVVIQKYLQRLKAATQLVVCSGNHDLDSRNEAGEKVARWVDRLRQRGIPTDGDSLAIGETLFTICPWWDGPATREAVDRQFRRDAETEKKSWIWVYHSPPDGSPTSSGRGRSYGDKDLSDWVAEFGPDIVLTGHIHQAPFIEGGSWADRIGSTWVFNAGRQIGEIPTHVAFDMAEGEALWMSLSGGETLRLDAPLQRPLPKLTALPAWFKA